jgi:hypothetical protein
LDDPLLDLLKELSAPEPAPYSDVVDRGLGLNEKAYASLLPCPPVDCGVKGAGEGEREEEGTRAVASELWLEKVEVAVMLWWGWWGSSGSDCRRRRGGNDSTGVGRSITQTVIAEWQMHCQMQILSVV